MQRELPAITLTSRSATGKLQALANVCFPTPGWITSTVTSPRYRSCVPKDRTQRNPYDR
jgi:hypothetical protein